MTKAVGKASAKPGAANFKAYYALIALVAGLIAGILAGEFSETADQFIEIRRRDDNVIQVCSHGRHDRCRLWFRGRPVVGQKGAR